MSERPQPQLPDNEDAETNAILQELVDRFNELRKQLEQELEKIDEDKRAALEELPKSVVDALSSWQEVMETIEERLGDPQAQMDMKVDREIWTAELFEQLGFEAVAKYYFGLADEIGA
jgi:hypothetical protein